MPNPLSNALAIVVADRRRLVMLQLLAEQPMTAAELGTHVELTAAAVSHHLQLLAHHSWVAALPNAPQSGRRARLWAATPGVDWAAVATTLNALQGRLQPPDGPPDAR